MSIDTLTLAQRLRASELPAAQAEAIAAAIGAAVLEGAATKDDLAAAKTELKSEIDQVRTGLELKIEQLRTEMERSHNQLFVRLVGTQTALAGLIVAAIKLL